MKEKRQNNASILHGLWALVFLLFIIVAVTAPLVLSGCSLQRTGLRPPLSEGIAFVSQQDQQGNINNEVYWAFRDGREQINMTMSPASDINPAYSTHGNQIAFASDRTGNWDIFNMLDEGTPMILTNDSMNDLEPAFSPDGSQIAFATNRDGNFEVYIMNATDGTGQANLTGSVASSVSNNRQPAFSPDGRIAFVSDRDGGWSQIYIMNANGSGQTNLTDDIASSYVHPSFSPEGDRIAYASNVKGDYEIWIRNADGTGVPTNLTTYPGASDIEPVFRPDGRIVFGSDRDDPNFEVYIMNADGTGVTRLTTNTVLDLPRLYSLR